MPTTYERQLNAVQNAHRQLGSTLIAMQHARADRQSGNLEGLSLDGAHQAEALACKMRHLKRRNVPPGIPDQRSAQHSGEFLIHSGQRIIDSPAAPSGQEVFQEP